MAIAHSSGGVSDRALHRMVIGLAIGLSVLLAAFSLIYYLGQHRSAGPSLTERQVVSAEAAVKANPNDLSLRLQLAAAYRENQRYTDAITQYDELLRVGPTNRSTLVGKGETQMDMGDLTGATASLQKVIGAKMTWAYETVDPQLQKAFYDLGSISTQQGKYAEAATYLLSALKIDSTDADSLYLLGTVELKSNDAAGALSSFQQAVLFVPTGWADPYTGMSQAYTKLGKAPEASYATAMAAFCNGDLDSAKTTLTSLTSTSVKVDAMLGLGMIAEKVNDNATAISWYQKVLKARPGDFTATSGLSRLNAVPSAAPSAKKA